MKSMEWKTYRTRFLVKAKKLNYSLTFTDPLGRQHCGRRGDYLVESSDGVISIAPRQIFEDVYVPMSASERVADARLTDERLVDERLDENSLTPVHTRISSRQVRFEPLRAEKIVSRKISQPLTSNSQLNQADGRSRRKSPQPVHSLRVPSQLGYLGSKAQQL